MLDGLEQRYGTNVLLADSDGDRVADGFEYLSALDLNSVALPYPGKRPYPNPLDKEDADADFDGDGLELGEEFRAWNVTGRPIPLSYSDGSQRTGGIELTDNRKDADQDGLNNFDELSGPMNPEWWVQMYNGTNGPLERKYPSREFLGTLFDDADSDGDTVLDGADDEDHDGFSNAFEAHRPGDRPGEERWQDTYVSFGHPFGTNPKARVQPFNPCKPYHSNMCHLSAPIGYYIDPETGRQEDWDTPVEGNGPDDGA